MYYRCSLLLPQLRFSKYEKSITWTSHCETLPIRNSINQYNKGQQFISQHSTLQPLVLNTLAVSRFLVFIQLLLYSLHPHKTPTCPWLGIAWTIPGPLDGLNAAVPYNLCRILGNKKYGCGISIKFWWLRQLSGGGLDPLSPRFNSLTPSPFFSSHQFFFFFFSDIPRTKIQIVYTPHLYDPPPLPIFIKCTPAPPYQPSHPDTPPFPTAEIFLVQLFDKNPLSLQAYSINTTANYVLVTPRASASAARVLT